MTEATHRIADHASRLTLADLPDVVVERAKLTILDTLGVTVAGSHHAAIDIAAGVVGTGIGGGGATVIGRNASMPAAPAAFVNGCAAHVLDFDDSGHSAAHTVPATLALAEEQGSSGETFLVGYVVGREVRMRLNEEIDSGRFDLRGRGPGARGWHATGTLGSLGSAAGAGKVLGLDTQEMAMAIGLSASLASGIIANFGTMTKCVHVGNAARNGVEAAQLVARGFTADSTIFTSTKGFVEAMCLEGECDIDAVADRLEAGFLLEEKGFRIKPYPSCTGSHRYIEAVRELVAQHGIAPDDVEAIWCTAQPSLVCPEPHNDLECRFSAPFAIAATLIDGAVTMTNTTQAFLDRADVRGLLARTTELPQEAIGRVRVRTRDGAEHEQTVLPPPSLDSFDEVVAKFRGCAIPVVGEAAASAVVRAIEDLERVPDVRSITTHLGTMPSLTLQS